MILYTCPQKKKLGSIGHPCGAAAIALDEAGLDYEIETVGGYKRIPLTTRGGGRDKLVEISGQEWAPVLQLDDGEVVVGTKQIKEWAKANAASSAHPD